MTTSHNIDTALNILKYRDWTWEMADDNFMGRHNQAKAEMRAFVAEVNKIDDIEVRNALRRYWILKYNSLQALYKGEKFRDKDELESLKARFNSAA